MTKPQHTPEPWENAGRTIYTVGGNCIASVWCERDMEDGLMTIETTIDDDEAAANSARIVACVNACTGIDDPAALRAQGDGNSLGPFQMIYECRKCGTEANHNTQYVSMTDFMSSFFILEEPLSEYLRRICIKCGHVVLQKCREE